ncbi:Carbonyl reductase [NADPH] 1 [Hypsibius exemplaris]|uniref:carbonyl reductase (NADPH) n=1 Tax=Hypsibius exemplaris TaxID=2072580 RepID=A0A1W0WL73_HYPEX|nr:Carbonyl reductase [NADPH] 1 [Hypsibius exemplaris]
MASRGAVALVTGANKGIGLQIVKDLCSQNFAGTVYLAARDRSRGQDAVRKLQNDGYLDVQFLPLDVLDIRTIKSAREFLKAEHGGLDILVNNAGILFYGKSKEDFPREAEVTMRTNFHGLLDVCNEFFPLLRKHARVVNVSSILGNLRYIKDNKIKERLIADDLTIEELEGLMLAYNNAVKNGNYAELGYPGWPDMYGAYPMSKIGVTALTRIQQRQLDIARPEDDIIVNAAHPGYVSTDMTSHKGTLTVEEGSDTPVYLALLPPAGGSASGSDTPRGELEQFEKKAETVRPNSLPLKHHSLYPTESSSGHDVEYFYRSTVISGHHVEYFYRSTVILWAPRRVLLQIDGHPLGITSSTFTNRQSSSGHDVEYFYKSTVILCARRRVLLQIDSHPLCTTSSNFTNQQSSSGHDVEYFYKSTVILWASRRVLLQIDSHVRITSVFVFCPGFHGLSGFQFRGYRLFGSSQADGDVFRRI